MKKFIASTFMATIQNFALLVISNVLHEKKKKKIVRHVMFKLQFIFLVLFPFIFSIFVNCVGEPRGVGIHGAIWGAILSGSGKKQQSMFEFGRKITKTTKNFASKFFRKTKFQII